MHCVRGVGRREGGWRTVTETLHWPIHAPYNASLSRRDKIHCAFGWEWPDLKAWTIPVYYFYASTCVVSSATIGPTVFSNMMPCSSLLSLVFGFYSNKIKIFYASPASLQANSEIVSRIRPLPLPSTCSKPSLIRINGEDMRIARESGLMKQKITLKDKKSLENKWKTYNIIGNVHEDT
jgi:hypothetical protein